MNRKQRRRQQKLAKGKNQPVHRAVSKPAVSKPKEEPVLRVTRQEWAALYEARQRGEFMELCEAGEIDKAKALARDCLAHYQNSLEDD